MLRVNSQRQLNRDVNVIWQLKNLIYSYYFDDL